MCGGLADGDLVVPAQYSGADLHNCHGEALAGADGVCVILYFYPATCGPKAHGSSSAAGPMMSFPAQFIAAVDRVSVVSLLPLVKDAERSVDGESFRIEDLFIGA